MYAITTELGTFEAETEKAAKKMLRKATRETKKQNEVDEKNLEMATMKARAEGFRYLRMVADDEGPSTSWITRKGDAHFPAKVDREDEREFRTQIIDNIYVKTFGLEPVAVARRPSGYVVLIWVRDMSDDSMHCCAVGYNQDQTDILSDTETPSP